jgi:hypothetical protein
MGTVLKHGTLSCVVLSNADLARYDTDPVFLDGYSGGAYLCARTGSLIAAGSDICEIAIDPTTGCGTTKTCEIFPDRMPIQWPDITVCPYQP